MVKKQKATKTSETQNVSVGLRMEASLMKLKKFVDGLVDIYGQSTRIEPHEVRNVVTRKATALMEKGHYGKAIDEYNRLIAMGREEPSIYYNLGVCCEYENLDEEAQKAYKKAIEIDKDFQDALYRLGLLAIKNDNPKAAVRYLNIVAGKNGGSFDVLYQLGVSYDKLKDHEKAIENFKKAIAVEPKYPKVYKRLGYTYDAINKHQEAVECFKKAMELEEI